MATSLDDLDRLAFLLARVVRTHHPTWLTQGFTLGDLETRLVPFPDARRELADGSPASYERLVLRLLTGERGYLLTDPELRDAARRALAQADPALGPVRPWAATRVVLARPSAGLGVDRSRPPAAGDPPAPWLDAEDAEDAEDASTHPAAPTGGSTWDTAAATPTLRSPHAAPAADAARARPPAPSAAHATAHTTAPAAPCLHCGGALPSQRGISFCPHCGCDLRRRQCPACSTAMDHDWRFCVTCGRGADDAPPARLAG
jgi:hypothetical protein